MRVSICESKAIYTIEAGDLIIAKHIKGDILNYLVIKERDELVPKYRLLNLDSSFIMATFSSGRTSDVVTYVTKSLKCEILSVIPASKLQLGLK